MSFSKVLKKAIACFLCAAMGMVMLTGCDKEKEVTKTTATNSDSDSSSSVTESVGEEVEKDAEFDASKSEADYPMCLDEESGYTDMVNYTMPEKGEEIVVMTIKDKGTVKIKLFPELLPKACANFTGLVQKGYYDGLTFHRVMADFMIQGGDPMGNGMGGESVWGLKFDGGYSKYLPHVKGALSYANSGGTYTNGSQFFIVVGEKYPEEVTKQYSAFSSSDTVVKEYAENGGTPWLDTQHTVFGQVFEGLDIVVDICNNTKTDSKNKPLEDVIIEKVEIVEYEG